MRKRQLLRRMTHLDRSQDEQGFVILETGILQDEKKGPEAVQNQGAGYDPEAKTFDSQAALYYSIERAALIRSPAVEQNRSALRSQGPASQL